MACESEERAEYLPKSEQRFRDLVENTSDWVWEVDEGLRYVYASPKVIDLIGYSADEVLGKTPFDFMPADEAARIKAGIEELTKNPQPFQELENVNIHKDGSLRVLETSGVPVFAADGRFAGLRGIDRDITERKLAREEIGRLHDALAERAAELESANEELQSFSYTVAHDLRQPLNLLSSYNQLIETMYGAQLPDDCLGYIREEYQVIARMNQLIEQLLRFSRFAHVELHRQQVDLSMLAQEVCLSHTVTDPSRDVTFVVSPEMLADCDPNLMMIAINNLLGNAWKYTSTKETAVIEFGVKENGGGREFFVRDNGVGFSMTDATRLFTPFYRHPSSEKHRGFGIGLATVERVIRRHGGRVWAEGEVGEGACIYFTLGGSTP